MIVPAPQRDKQGERSTHFTGGAAESPRCSRCASNLSTGLAAPWKPRSWLLLQGGVLMAKCEHREVLLLRLWAHWQPLPT